MPTEPDPITLSEIARRATEIVDPNGADDDVARIYTQLEDDDRPITAVQASRSAWRWPRRAPTPRATTRRSR